MATHLYLPVARRFFAMAVAALVLPGAGFLRAEVREFKSSEGTAVTAEAVAHDGNGTLTLKLENGTTSKVPVSKLSVADQEWAEGWIKANPATRSYNFKFEVTEKKLADLERTNAGYLRSKKQRWAYSVVITNTDRIPVSDLTVRYRVFMSDEVSDGIGVGVSSATGEGYRQKEGEIKIPGEMRYNDRKEFTSESFDLDETRYSYYYSRSRSKDRLAGMMIRIYDRTGRPVETFRTSEKWLASLEWKEDSVAGEKADAPPEMARTVPTRPTAPTTPTAPEPAEPAGSNGRGPESARMGPARIEMARPAKQRPVKETAASATALMMTPTGGVAAVTFLATVLAGGSEGSAMPVIFSDPVNRELGARMAGIGSALGSNGEGWPLDHESSLTWSTSFDPSDGAAASGACALALDALAGGIAIDPAVAVAVELNGELQAEGHTALAARARAAVNNAAGCEILLVPPDARDTAGDLMVTGETDLLLKCQWIEVADLAGMRAVARRDRDPKLQQAIDEFAALRVFLGTSGTGALKSPPVLASLNRIAAAVPSHLSAASLLAFATSGAPASLSLSGSYEILWKSAGPFIGAVRQHLGGNFVDVEPTRNSLSDMRRMRPKMHAKVIELVDGVIDLENLWRDYAARGGQGQNSPLYPEMSAASRTVSKLATEVEAGL